MTEAPRHEALIYATTGQLEAVAVIVGDENVSAS